MIMSKNTETDYQNQKQLHSPYVLEHTRNLLCFFKKLLHVHTYIYTLNKIINATL